MAAAAAPAMLCYVTRPDAVLMEVEVEAKANGEDCLNQVTTRGQAGAPAGPPRRRGLAAAPGSGARRLPGGGRRCGGGRGGGGGLVGERAPGARPAPPFLPVAVGHAVPARWERVVGGGEEAPTLPPTPLPVPHFPGRRRSSPPAAGVCMMPPFGSPRGLAAPPESRDEVAAGRRWSLGLLGRQARPLSLAASEMDRSPAPAGLRGSRGPWVFGHPPLRCL